MLFEKKILNIYRTQFFSRCDDTGLAHYFSAADFPGLRQQALPFPSSLGHTLQGWLYSYEEIIPGRLVVFDHGLGGGHKSYMKEIEKLCRHGYLVFAYDHTGCMASGGENTRGLAQSLVDLKDCIQALRSTPGIGDLDISVVGHSWGAYAAMNIPAFYPEISHIVAMSGYISVEAMARQFFTGILGGYRKPVLRLEQAENPDFVHYDAVHTLSETGANVLLIYSANDKIVNREMHHDVLKKALAGKKNIRIILEQNKGHNPNYTADAAACLGQFTGELARKLKDGTLKTDAQKQAFRNHWDWDRMTAQDENVWKEIFRTLDSE